jgi:hypothetical protein
LLLLLSIVFSFSSAIYSFLLCVIWLITLPQAVAPPVQADDTGQSARSLPLFCHAGVARTEPTPICGLCCTRTLHTNLWHVACTRMSARKKCTSYTNETSVAGRCIHMKWTSMQYRVPHLVCDIELGPGVHQKLKSFVLVLADSQYRCSPTHLQNASHKGRTLYNHYYIAFITSATNY